MKIEDNFLDQKEFDNLQIVIMGEIFTWNYITRIDSGDDVDKFQFTHMFYFNNAPTSPFLEIITPIINKI